MTGHLKDCSDYTESRSHEQSRAGCLPLQRDVRASFILLSAPFVLLSRHQAKGEQFWKDATLDAVPNSGGCEIGY
jgi:hypothetical protein